MLNNEISRLEAEIKRKKEEFSVMSTEKKLGLAQFENSFNYLHSLNSLAPVVEDIFVALELNVGEKRKSSLKRRQNSQESQESDDEIEQ